MDITPYQICPECAALLDKGIDSAPIAWIRKRYEYLVWENYRYGYRDWGECDLCGCSAPSDRYRLEGINFEQRE